VAYQATYTIASIFIDFKQFLIHKVESIRGIHFWNSCVHECANM